MAHTKSAAWSEFEGGLNIDPKRVGQPYEYSHKKDPELKTGPTKDTEDSETLEYGPGTIFALVFVLQALGLGGTPIPALWLLLYSGPFDTTKGPTLSYLNKEKKA